MEYICTLRECHTNMYFLAIKAEDKCMDFIDIVFIYCRVPEGRDLHKTARPPGRDETRSVNPLVRTQVDFDLTKCIQTKKR